jgi:WhiB family transcriptional regulator, redox-sensing transcriptional regulator
MPASIKRAPGMTATRTYPDRARKFNRGRPLDTSAGTDWRHLAACRNEDPELFFPTGTTGPALEQIDQAKAVCRRCPVSGECLSWALDTGQDSGVWGGASEDERRAASRRGLHKPVSL